MATIGVDFVKNVIEVGGKRVLVQTWDTAGQERFKSITSAYYRGSSGAIICYDCTSKETFDNAKLWIEEFRTKTTPTTPIILVACKGDLKSQPLITDVATERQSEVININMIENDDSVGYN